MKNKKFNFKSFTSLLLVLTMGSLMVSGIVLYIAPHCGVARSLQWTLLGADKSAWENLHVVTGFIFLILSFIHLIVFNWSSLKSYVAGSSKKFRLSKEVIVTVFVFLFILSGTLYEFKTGQAGFPPFSTMANSGEQFKKMWVEGLDLETFCTKFKLSYTRALSNLEEANITVRDQSMSVKEIALANNLKLRQLYRIIQKGHKRVRKTNL